MALGTNRDYKTNEKRVKSNLKKHAEIMKRLMEEEGMNKTDASKKALELVLKGKRK